LSPIVPVSFAVIYPSFRRVTCSVRTCSPFSPFLGFHIFSTVPIVFFATTTYSSCAESNVFRDSSTRFSSAARTVSYHFLDIAICACVRGPYTPASLLDTFGIIPYCTWYAIIASRVVRTPSIYPRSVSVDRALCGYVPSVYVLVFASLDISIFPLDSAPRSIYGPLYSESIFHFTVRRPHSRALRSHSSPLPTHISIRSWSCPRTPACTIAPHLSATCPTPTHSRYICVPNAYPFGAASIPAKTAFPLAP
jgi:hypothetical protein